MTTSIRDLATATLCIVAAACSTDVTDLKRVPPASDAEDSGVATAADAGIVIEVDAGAASAPQGCEQGWLDVAQLGAEGGAVTGTSFAAQAGAFALTWTERTGASSETKTRLAFFDALGAIRGEPIEVGARSR